MVRIGVVVAVLLFAASRPATAESPVERALYLVSTIMACGNCHTPRDADGRPIADKALSGDLTFTTLAFVATAPNITGDVETGIGGWSDAEIKRALVEGMRPDHGRLAGVPLAAIMPAGFYKVLLPNDLDAIVAYLRTIKPVRNKVPAPVYKTAGCAAIPIRMRRRASTRRRLPIRSSAAPISPPSAIAWSAIPRGGAASRISPPDWAGAAGPSRRARGRLRERRPASPPTTPRIRPPASAPGPIRKSLARSRWEPRATAEHSSRRWFRLLRRAKGWRSRGDHRLLAYGAAAAMMPWQNRRSTDCPEIVSCRRQRANFVCKIRL
jgi:mono/diheme cytochrome c family protein